MAHGAPHINALPKEQLGISNEGSVFRCGARQVPSSVISGHHTWWPHTGLALKTALTSPPLQGTSQPLDKGQIAGSWQGNGRPFELPRGSHSPTKPLMIKTRGTTPNVTQERPHKIQILFARGAPDVSPERKHKNCVPEMICTVPGPVTSHPATENPLNWLSVANRRPASTLKASFRGPWGTKTGHILCCYPCPPPPPTPGAS